MKKCRNENKNKGKKVTYFSSCRLTFDNKTLLLFLTSSKDLFSRVLVKRSLSALSNSKKKKNPKPPPKIQTMCLLRTNFFLKNEAGLTRQKKKICSAY